MKLLKLSDNEYKLLIEMLNSYSCEHDGFGAEYDSNKNKYISEFQTSLLFNGHGADYENLIMKVYDQY